MSTKRNKKVQIAEPRMRTLVHAQVRDEKIHIMPPCWVKGLELTEATGWDHKKKARMRSQGNVRFEKRADGMWYDLASVHPLFLKQHA
jgi:hypothetical protein